jgi:hypothetical protein
MSGADLRVAEGNTAYVGRDDEPDGHSLANGRLQDHEAALEDHVHLGHGLFTDAYDLFIIGVVIALLKDEWHPSP